MQAAVSRAVPAAGRPAGQRGNEYFAGAERALIADDECFDVLIDVHGPRADDIGGRGGQRVSCAKWRRYQNGHSQKCFLEFRAHDDTSVATGLNGMTMAEIAWFTAHGFRVICKLYVKDI